MHRELRATQVDGPHPGRGADDRPDRGTAPAVVPHDEFLHGGQAGPPGDLPHDEARDAVRRVPLVGVPLDDHPVVHAGGVILLVLRGVVRMDRVGLIDAQDEGSGEGRGVEIVAPSRVAGPEGGRDASDRLGHDGRTGTGEAAGSDFLVIEERDHGDVLVVGEEVQPVIAGGVVHESAEGEVAAGQVVESGRVDEFRVGTAEGGRLDVVEVQFEVGDVLDVDPQFRRDHTEEDGFLVLRPSILDGRRRVLLRLFLLAGVSTTLAPFPPRQRLFHLRRQNRAEMILLVDGEGLPFLGRLEVNGEVGYAYDGPVQLDQFLLDAIAVLTANEDAAGDSEVAVFVLILRRAKASRGHTSGRSH
mmetsp:Transcript_28855/g.85203  ORF Transcript_28855/g.85203 Transcript_28855/m.85203 type:complete len:359 (-) Transcript_28855:865-1941(-)